MSLSIGRVSRGVIVLSCAFWGFFLPACGGGGGSDGGGGSPPPPSPSPWTEKISNNGAPMMPSMRHSHSVVWDGTRLILFGGNASGAQKNDTWWYDPTLNEWTQKIADAMPGSPPAFDGHGMVWDGTRVILFGGLLGGSTANSTWWYDPGGNAWTEKIVAGTPGCPSNRRWHSLVWDGTRAILFGGSFTGIDYLNDLWWYDPVGNAWTQKIADGAPGSPTQRYSHSAFWDGTRMILFGGYESSATNKNDLWWYDPGGNQWTQKIVHGFIGSPPARNASPMVWTGTRGILFSGFGVGNDLWWYDPAGNSWSLEIEAGTAGSPGSRSNHSLTWDGTRAVLVCGFGVENALWWYVP